MKSGKTRESLTERRTDGKCISCVSGKIFRDPEMYIYIVSYRVIQDSVPDVVPLCVNLLVSVQCREA